MFLPLNKIYIIIITIIVVIIITSIIIVEENIEDNRIMTHVFI